MDEEQDVTPEGEDSSPDQTVPYDRFKEVNEQRKAAEERAKALEQKTGELSEQEKAEKQAKEYIRNLLKEEQEAERQAQKQKEAEEQKKFNEDVDDLMSVHTDVKRTEFLKFIEENNPEFEFSSPKAAMAAYRKINNLSKEVEEKVKDNLNKKPSMPRNEGVRTEAPPDDTNKSLQDIVQEEIAKLED